MEIANEKPRRVHQGRNVKRFREMLGIKQEALAHELGDNWSQKRVSLLENKEAIEPEVLSQVAKALNVSEEAIKNFDEDFAINIISNTFNNNDNSATLQGHYINYNPSFNPIEKIVELYDEKVALLERLLESEREKIQILLKQRRD
ncbi:helix-turn-helix domain-containing protein [Siphonobacter curvatus]|uniref:Transcriptional regulator n=1 Tax=Siphonobacter curvatus TaxID=2094562 RepID=A0A2S7IN64_9BACT|nr:helix-turn-helix transcriptional regulator [Siphonobacter curvatus]PQA59000.1 transcriptional regulator [Siphonobacter curvatus]